MSWTPEKEALHRRIEANVMGRYKRRVELQLGVLEEAVTKALDGLLDVNPYQDTPSAMRNAIDAIYSDLRYATIAVAMVELPPAEDGDEDGDEDA